MFADSETILTVDPPAWLFFFLVVASLVVVIEIVMLALWCQRGKSVWHELFLTISVIVAGPIVGLVGLIGVTRSVAVGKMKGWHLLIAGARGTLVLFLVVLILNSLQIGTILVIGIGAIIWTIRSYQKTSSPLSIVPKVCLIAIRSLVIILIIIWVINPTMTRSTMTLAPVRLIVAVDHSKSMQQSDMPKDFRLPVSKENSTSATRTQSVKAALLASEPLFQAAKEQGVGVYNCRFHSTATRPISMRDWDMLSKECYGFNTAIGDSVLSMVANTNRDLAPIGAILILSDGCNNQTKTADPKSAIEQIVNQRLDLGRPSVLVYTVGVGASNINQYNPTLLIKGIDVPEVVSAFDAMTIVSRVDTFGLVGCTVVVTCSLGDRLVGSRIVKVTSNNQSLPVSFTYMPYDRGYHSLRIEAKARTSWQSRKPVTTQISKLINVITPNRRVLLLSSKGNNAVELIGAIDKFSGYDIDQIVLSKPKTLETFGYPPGDIAQWFRYDAIVIDNLSANYFTNSELQIIRKLVYEFGRGLCMIGGSRSFGQGNWHNSPISSLLPIDVAKSTGYFSGPVTVAPTQAGLDLGIFPVVTNKQQKAKYELQMATVNRLVCRSGDSTILAGSRSEPLAISQVVGAGRVMAVGWNASKPKRNATNSKNRSDRVLRYRFWQQMIRIVAKPSNSIWIHTDSINYTKSMFTQPIQIRIGSKYKDLSAEITPVVTLLTPKNDLLTVTVRLDNKTNVFTGSLPPISQIGLYTIGVSLKQSGVLVPELAVVRKLYLRDNDPESKLLPANFDILKDLARIGGGQFTELSGVQNMIGDLITTIRPEPGSKIIIRSVIQPWRWLLLLLIFGLLSVGWILRKRLALI